MVAILFSFEFRDFLTTDKCLDLGGRVLYSGLCEFVGGSVRALELNKIELSSVLFAGVVVCNVIGFCVYAIGAGVFKITG